MWVLFLQIKPLNIIISTDLDDLVKPKTEKEKLKELFPALCRANDPIPQVFGINIYFGNNIWDF